jgi:hypothetical protein
MFCFKLCFIFGLCDNSPWCFVNLVVVFLSQTVNYDTMLFLATEHVFWPPLPGGSIFSARVFLRDTLDKNALR